MGAAEQPWRGFREIQFPFMHLLVIADLVHSVSNFSAGFLGIYFSYLNASRLCGALRTFILCGIEGDELISGLVGYWLGLGVSALRPHLLWIRS